MRDKPKRFVRVCTCTTCNYHPHSTVAKQHRAINRVLVALDEKNRRRFVGVLALQWGHGGMERLMAITGLSRNTIRRGRDEIQRKDQVPTGRIRQAGGGRQPIEKKDPTF